MTSASAKYPVVVPGVGPIPAPGMIIGEAPGRKEIEQGKPFVGQSGRVLDEALLLGGSDRSYFYVTNVFKGDVGSGNRNPTFNEINAHRHILDSEIAGTVPKAILLLGAFATRTFIPVERGMGAIVGTVCTSESLGDAKLFPCYHPAATLYNPRLRKSFNATVLKFVKECFDRQS